MRTIIKILTAAIPALLLWSCDTGKPGQEETGAIALSGAPVAVAKATGTRAAAGFPNEGSIGVIAAYDEGNGAIDWLSYPDIYNARATATGVAGGVYSFTWNEPKYWPYDDRKLSFMAYSPAAGSQYFLLSTETPILNIWLNDDMDDIMYAMGNTSPIAGPHWKSERAAVNLGQFKHVLSQLTVQVVGDPAMSPTIVISNLEVSTTNENATFDLTKGDDGFALTGLDGEYFAYEMVQQATPFLNPSFSKTILLYPGTEEVTKISITLMDQAHPNSSVTKSYMMPYFQNITNIGSPVTLERGVNTILQIYVKSINVVDSDIDLLGQVSDWNYGQNFGVTIN